MLREYEQDILLNQTDGSTDEADGIFGPYQRPSYEHMEEPLSPGNSVEKPDELKVKVFIINDDGNWSDCGIGTLIFINNTEIVVCSDDNDLKERDVIAPDRGLKLRGGYGTSSLEIMNNDRGELLLKLDLKNAKNFIKTQTTILSWDQIDINENIALSFVYSYDCLSIWKYICSIFNIQMEEEEVEVFTMSKDEIEPITDYLSKIEYFEEERKNVIYHFCNKGTMFDKARSLFDDAKSTLDIDTMVKMGRMIEALISCCNADLNLKMFSDPLWKFVFEALEYTEENYDTMTGVKKHSYLDFLQNHSKMMYVDKASLIQGFEDLVKLRFRVNFYMEYVLSSKNINSELLSSHFQMLMQTLNVHLLDFLMNDDFIVKSLYPQDEESKLKVSDFASEFFALYKGLSNEVKIDISQSFRQKNIGKYAISQIYDLLVESSNNIDQENTQSQVFTIKLSSENEMKKQWDLNIRKLVLAHLEILYISCRIDKTYAYELFREFEHTQETIELLLEFPDDSAFDIFIELLFPKGDPFGKPQLLLISVLGMSTIEGACERLRKKVERRNQSMENGNDSEDIKEVNKIIIKYFYRLVMYLCICVKSISPNAVKKMTEIRIGEFLSNLFGEIDPRLCHKNIQFALTKFFQLLVESEIPGVRELSIQCDFALNIYKKHIRRTNLINSQYMLIFKTLGSTWDTICRDFVKRNIEEILRLKSEGDEGIIMLTLNIFDWNDNIIDNPPHNDNDICSHSFNSKPSNSFNFQEEETASLYNMMCNSLENEKNSQEVELPSIEFSFEEKNDKEFKMTGNVIGKESPDKINRQFTLGNNEANNFEDEEENEAKLKLKSLLANMKKKGQEEKHVSDITSFLNNSDNGYSSTLEEPKQLTFKFLNTAIEDENDDDGLLPPISHMNDNEENDFMQKEIDLDISLGKRMRMFEGNESFDDEIKKKLKIN